MTRNASAGISDVPPLSVRQALLRIGVTLAACQITWMVDLFSWSLYDGVAFVAFWSLPRRWWPWLATALIAQGTLIDAWRQTFNELPVWPSPLHYFLGTVAPNFFLMAGVEWLRRRGGELGRPVKFAGIARLLVAAVLVATLFTAKDLLYVLAEGQVGDIRDGGRIVNMVPLGTPDDTAVLVPFAISHFIGAFIGIMLVAPMGMWWCNRRDESGSHEIVVAGMKWLLPAAAAYLLSAEWFAQMQVAEVLRLLLLVAVAVFALRYGWRGAALATFLVSLAVAVQDHLGSAGVQPILIQSFIAIAGAMGLMFGAARDELAQRGREMAGLADRLRDTARRNQTQADELRRWITSEVHDEVGQNLTALQMQIRLAENESGRPGLFAPMREIVGHMRKSVSTLLGSLRPAGIDEFGLVRTLAEGSIAQLVQAAGVAYSLRISGDADLLERLPDEVRVTLYRIVQEAATNALRHADASRFRVGMRVCSRGGSIGVALRCADDGVGIDLVNKRPGGLGLHGIEDRIIAIGGSLRIHSNGYGTRILTLINAA